MTKYKPRITKIIELEKDVRFFEKRLEKYQKKIAKTKIKLGKLLEGWAK